MYWSVKQQVIDSWRKVRWGDRSWSGKKITLLPVIVLVLVCFMVGWWLGWLSNTMYDLVLSALALLVSLTLRIHIWVVVSMLVICVCLNWYVNNPTAGTVALLAVFGIFLAGNVGMFCIPRIHISQRILVVCASSGLLVSIYCLLQDMRLVAQPLHIEDYMSMGNYYELAVMTLYSIRTLLPLLLLNWLVLAGIKAGLHAPEPENATVKELSLKSKGTEQDERSAGSGDLTSGSLANDYGGEDDIANAVTKKMPETPQPRKLLTRFWPSNPTPGARRLLKSPFPFNDVP